MAYNFIPTTPKDISQKIKGDIADEITSLLIQLQSKYSMVKDPISLDANSPKNIKITRKFQGSLDIKTLQTKYKLIKLSFGEGSRGGRGTQNKGNLFEYQLAKEIENWWKGETISDASIKTFIDDLVKTYDLQSWTELYVDAEGAANKPRPLMFNGSSVLISPGLGDIGPTVTDLTLRKGTNNTSPAGVYLSLKYSATVTFFNAGTKKYLSDAELQSGLINNEDGKKLLKLFGINNAVFCSVFNGTGKNLGPVDTTNLVDKDGLETLIKSGIGYGYHMVHKLGGKIVSKKIDSAYRDKASRVNNVIVYYGGKTGTGARVDIEVTTPVYKLKFNFRNKQGGKYISHLMCDYSYI